MAIALFLAGAALSASASYQQGEARAQAAQYGTAVARNNQMISEENAQLEESRGRMLEEQEQKKTAQIVGSIRAGYAASGIDVNSGSALNTQSDTETISEANLGVIRANAARAAYNYRVQGMNQGEQAKLDEIEATNASRFGRMSAIGSLVSSAGTTRQKFGSIN